MLPNVLPPFFPQHHSFDLEEFLIFPIRTKYSRLRPVLFYLEPACHFVVFMFGNIMLLFVEVILHRLEKS